VLKRARPQEEHARCEEERSQHAATRERLRAASAQAQRTAQRAEGLEDELKAFSLSRPHPPPLTNTHTPRAAPPRAVAICLTQGVVPPQSSMTKRKAAQVQTPPAAARALALSSRL